MIVNHSLRFVFFVNPMTGSGRLWRALLPLAEEEVAVFRARSGPEDLYRAMPPAEARRALATRGIDLGSYRSLTLVRDPFARLPDVYRRIAATDPAWRRRRDAGLGDPPFCDWVRTTSPRGRGAGGRAHEVWRRFGTWSAAVWSGGVVDHVLPVEHLDDTLPPLLSLLGLPPVDLPPSATPPPGDWRTSYDAETAALVARRYRADLARFGYRHPAADWGV